MTNSIKKHFFKSKTNIVQLCTIGAGGLVYLLNDDMKNQVCKVLCDSPKSATMILITTAVINLFARNVKSDTTLKVKK